MAEPLLAVQGLTKSYDGWSKALDGVSMAVARGEFVSIIGSSALREPARRPHAGHRVLRRRGRYPREGP